MAGSHDRAPSVRTDPERAVSRDEVRQGLQGEDGRSAEGDPEGGLDVYCGLYGTDMVAILSSFGGRIVSFELALTDDYRGPHACAPGKTWPSAELEQLLARCNDDATCTCLFRLLPQRVDWAAVEPWHENLTKAPDGPVKDLFRGVLAHCAALEADRIMRRRRHRDPTSRRGGG